MIIMPKEASWMAYSFLLLFLTTFTFLVAFKSENFMVVGGYAQRRTLEVITKLQ